MERVRRSPARLLALLLAATSLLAFSEPPEAAPAAGPAGAQEPGFVIRTETQLVLVPFYVVHKKKYVEDLGKEEIQVLEDNVPQKIAIFEGPGTAGRTIPIDVTLLLDVSLSVMNKSLLDGFSVRDTLFDGLGDNVRVSVYAFANKLRRFTAPTHDLKKLETALTRAYESAHGGTRLYEAVVRACEDSARFSAGRNRLMVILSDGFSTAKTPPDEAIAAARYFGMTLYPVVLGHAAIVQRAAKGRSQTPMRGRINIRSRSPWGRRLLPGAGVSTGRARIQNERQSRAHQLELRMARFAAIGDATGGRSFDPITVNNMMIRKILRAIVKQVQDQYVAGYYPASSGAEKRPHPVKVILRNPNRGKIYGGERVVSH